MRKLGMVLMVLGVFCLVSALIAAFGPILRANGINVFAAVTSIKGVATAGALLLVLGATMRRIATRKLQRKA